MDLEIIFSEFYSKNTVDVGHFQEYFPEADIKVYTESNTDLLFRNEHPRCNYHMHDYFQVRAMLDSKADIVLAFDADMRIVSDHVRSILRLAKRFGLCVPSNSRFLVRTDTLIGADSDKMLDETNGNGYALNSAIYAFETRNMAARNCLEEFCEIMLQAPVRAPLALWRAIYRTGYFPCLLPPQWCVCEADLGIGEEIVLHVGHEKVRKFYGLSSN